MKKDSRHATSSEQRWTPEYLLGVIDTIQVEHVTGLDPLDLLTLRDLALKGLASSETKPSESPGVLWYKLDMAARHFDQVEDEELSEACREAQRLTLVPSARALSTDAKDAARYRWLRDRKPNQLYLTFNEHACNYIPASEEIDGNPDQYKDETPEVRQAMKDADAIWKLQEYPHTPVGFHWIYRASLDDLIDAAMEEL